MTELENNYSKFVGRQRAKIFFKPLLKILKNNLELSYKIKLLHAQLSYGSTPKDIVRNKR